MKQLLILVALSFISGMQAVWGQIPQTISYQGVLTDASGTAVPDGNYNIFFKLYDDVTTGNLLWTEGLSVEVSKGIFNAILGTINPLNLAFDRQYWLGVTIGDGAELSPRTRLTATPYSLNARSIADSAVTGSKIASGQVVRSVNAIKDDVALAAGNNVTITQEGNTITIAAAGGDSGGNTLDQAYDQGGAGAGRQIFTDAGAVDIAGPDGLTVEGNVGIGTTDPLSKLAVEEIDSLGTEDFFNAASINLIRTAADNISLRNTQALQVKSIYASPAGTYYAPKAVEAWVENLSSAGAITEASALRGLVINRSTGAIESANGLYTTVVNSGTGTIENARSVFIASPANLGTIENNYGLFIENQAIGTNSYAIYSVGGKVYFADSVGIGTDHPRGNLHLSSNSDTKLRFTNGLGNDVAIVYNTDNNALEFRLGGAGTETKVVINDEGNVGIGEINPDNILTVERNSGTDPIADAWTTYSSRRWKTNIAPIAGALDKVHRLRGVSFDWKADGKHDIGLIAEEVGEVIPEVVAYEENGNDAKSVDYARLVAVLIEAMKEQQKQIEQQSANIEKLQDRLSTLEINYRLTSR